MNWVKTVWKDWWWLIILAIIKLTIQLIAAGQYGFHRDEYLYLAEAEHLAWGYLEVPPMIAFLGAVIRLFGDNIYWIKLFPALFGTISLVYVALMTKELGGKRWAQVVSCIAFIIVPSFLRSHHLFQPVVLNQFVWIILTYHIIRLIKTGNPKIWYMIGVIIGIGLLTKYSIAFPVIGLLGGMLLTPERKWFTRKEPYIAVLIALVIFSPNLWWQFDHNYPVIAHMNELRETQLVHVSTSDFFLTQFIMLFTATLLWVPALIGLFTKRLKTYRLLGWMYVILIGVLIATSGKAYYALGIYPVLLAAGAVWWEQIINDRKWLKVAIPAMIIIGSFGSIPYGIPILPVDTMITYGAWMKETFHLAVPLVWEDGSEHTLPQDYADMFGWEESVANAAKLYHALSDDEKATCNLWGGGYGHAGAMLFYANKYDLPKEVTCLNGSFALWAKTEASFDRQISIDDRISTTSEIFGNAQLVDSTRNIYARDKGYIIYKSDPTKDVSEAYRKVVQENQMKWTRK